MVRSKLNRDKRHLKIVQATANRWRIENASGIVILDDLMLESSYRADQFMKGYVSSFIDYNYEVIPLNKGDTNAK